MAGLYLEDPAPQAAPPIHEDDITDYDEDEDEDEDESFGDEDDEINSKMEEDDDPSPRESMDDEETEDTPKMPTMIEINPNKPPPEKDYYFEDDGSTIATRDTHMKFPGNNANRSPQWAMEVQEEDPRTRRPLRPLDDELGTTSEHIPYSGQFQDGQQDAYTQDGLMSYLLANGQIPEDYIAGLRLASSLQNLSALQRQSQMMQFEEDQGSASSSQRDARRRYIEEMNQAASSTGNAQWGQPLAQLQRNVESNDRRALLGRQLLGRSMSTSNVASHSQRGPSRFAQMETLGEMTPENFRQNRSVDNLRSSSFHAGDRQNFMGSQGRSRFYPGSMDNLLRASSFHAGDGQNSGRSQSSAGIHQHPMDSFGSNPKLPSAERTRAPIPPQRSSSGIESGGTAEMRRVVPTRSMSADGDNFFNRQCDLSPTIPEETAEEAGVRDGRWLLREISRRSVFSTGSNHGNDPPGWDSADEMPGKDDSGDEYSSSEESEYVSDFYSDDDVFHSSKDGIKTDDAESCSSKEADNSDSSSDGDGSVDQMLQKLQELKKRRSARPPSARFVVSCSDIKHNEPLKKSSDHSIKKITKKDAKTSKKHKKESNHGDDDDDTPESKRHSKLQAEGSDKQKSKKSSGKPSESKEKKKKSSKKKHKEDINDGDSPDQPEKAEKTKRKSSKRNKEEKTLTKKDEGKKEQKSTKVEHKSDDDKKKKRKDEGDKPKRKNPKREKDSKNEGQKVKDVKKDKTKEKKKSIKRVSSHSKVSDHTSTTRTNSNSTSPSDAVAAETKSYMFEEADVSNLVNKQGVWGDL